MGTRKRIRVPEAEVTLIWQRLAGEELTATGGERIAVIYPGRLNSDGGPDFRDAVIRNGARLMQGGVEVHTEAGDWFGHGHHRDSRYNEMILHVALWRGQHSHTVLESGRVVPVLCLAQALNHQSYLLPRPLPCYRTAGIAERQGTARLLRSAGEIRLRHKAAHFQAGMLDEGIIGAESIRAGQVLYQGITRALGYSKNTRPFEELARRVPLSHAESKEHLLERQSLLLGTAGLLPSQRRPGVQSDAQEVRDLEQAWHSMQRSAAVMSHEDWTFSHTYPNNSPVRRIIALSYLLERYCRGMPTEPPGRRLLAGLMRLVSQASLPGGHHTLENGLTVTVPGYWQDHFDLGIGSRTRTSAILGPGKAREIVINVLLPFAYAWGKLVREPGITSRAIALYRDYPGMASNEITRHMMVQLGLERSPLLGACRQQGLIHIFRNYCREGKCSDCLLAGEFDFRGFQR